MCASNFYFVHYIKVIEISIEKIIFFFPTDRPIFFIMLARCPPNQLGVALWPFWPISIPTLKKGGRTLCISKPIVTKKQVTIKKSKNLKNLMNQT